MMLKILIADDSLIIRKKITKIVENMNHMVVCSVSNGQEAIDAYIKYRPDLVTMDISMPVMDGITTVKAIIDYDKEAKIIMITSHGQEDMVIKSIQAGALGYILKPITEDKLAKIIGNVYNEYSTEIIDEQLGSYEEFIYLREQ